MRELSKNPFPSVEQIIRNGPRVYKAAGPPLFLDLFQIAGLWQH
jgi:hypothetical protein